MSSPPSHRSNPWAVLGVLCLGLFMTLVDMTIVNIALPEMIASLGASLDQALWIFSAYILGFATLLITSGRLGDLYGPRRVYLIGLAVFVAASGLAGLTATPAQLIAARALQGVGGALLAPSCCRSSPWCSRPPVGGRPSAPPARCPAWPCWSAPPWAA